MTNNFKPAKTGQQNNRLSREEYAEKMRKEKEAVYQMADETATGIVASPEKFKAFLDTQSRLDRYSAVNALLSRFCGYDRNGIACRRGNRFEMVRYRYGKRND